MKKVISVIFAIIMVLSFTTVAAVTKEDLTQTTEVKEAGIIIQSPTDWYILTRDMNEETPAIKELGIDLAGLKTQFEQTNIYFNTLPKDTSSELVVTMLSNVQTKLAPEYNKLTQEELDEIKTTLLASSVVETETNFGVKYLNADIYKNDTGTFVEVGIEQTFQGNTIYGKIYSTTMYGRTMAFTMNSYVSALTVDQEEILKLMVDNAQILENVKSDEVDVPDQDIEVKVNDTKDKDYTIYFIFVGAGVVALLAIIAVVLVKKKN